MKILLPFHPHHGENSCFSGLGNYYYYYHKILSCHSKKTGLSLVMSSSMKYNSWKSVLTFVFGKFSDMGAGLIKNRLDYFMASNYIQVGVITSKEFNQIFVLTKQIACKRSLQI